MAEHDVISYMMRDSLECNLSYMPFINDGGLFIPSMHTYALGDRVAVDLLLPGKTDAVRVEGKVIWITPRNALHHVLPGIGIQFTSANAATVRSQIESNIDSKNEVGGYTYGITEEMKKDK
jgi:type IV pilus assembly protein PilZ